MPCSLSFQWQIWDRALKALNSVWGPICADSRVLRSMNQTLPNYDRTYTTGYGTTYQFILRSPTKTGSPWGPLAGIPGHPPFPWGGSNPSSWHPRLGVVRWPINAVFRSSTTSSNPLGRMIPHSQTGAMASMSLMLGPVCRPARRACSKLLQITLVTYLLFVCRSNGPLPGPLWSLRLSLNLRRRRRRRNSLSWRHAVVQWKGIRVLFWIVWVDHRTPLSSLPRLLKVKGVRHIVFALPVSEFRHVWAMLSKSTTASHTLR